MQNGQAGKELYFKRIPIVPRSVKGPFRRFKTAVLWLGFAVYFLLPWLPWRRDDAPSQVVMFDIPGRRYLIFASPNPAGDEAPIALRFDLQP